MLCLIKLYNVCLCLLILLRWKKSLTATCDFFRANTKLPEHWLYYFFPRFKYKFIHITPSYTAALEVTVVFYLFFAKLSQASHTHQSAKLLLINNATCHLYGCFVLFFEHMINFDCLRPELICAPEKKKSSVHPLANFTAWKITDHKNFKKILQDVWQPTADDISS